MQAAAIKIATCMSVEVPCSAERVSSGTIRGVIVGRSYLISYRAGTGMVAVVLASQSMCFVELMSPMIHHLAQLKNMIPMHRIGIIMAGSLLKFQISIQGSTWELPSLMKTRA